MVRETIVSSARRVVPCDGCTACCRRERVILQPEDDARLYRTVPALGPGVGPNDRMLEHRVDGTCVYLGPGGCTIHDRAPLVCRKFDCRAWIQLGAAYPSELQPDDISGKVLEAGRSKADAV